MARPSPSAPAPAAEPAAGAPPSLPTVPLTVHLVSGDDALWSELCGRLPAVRWSQHDSVADLVEQIAADECALAVFDARSEPDLAAAIGVLLGHAPAVVPVALTDPPHEPAARRLLRSQLLFEVLPLSLAPRAMAERLERSADEALARRTLQPAAAASPGGAQGPARASGAPRSLLIAAAATAVLALLVLVVMRLERSRPEASPASVPVPAATSRQPAAAAPAPSPAADNVADTENELADARRALRDKRYVEPETDSALSHYRAALALSPASEEARQGLARVNEALLARAEAAVAARDYPTALRALEGSRALNPAHARLAALDVQLGQQRREFVISQIQAAIDADNFERAGQLIAQAEQRHQATPLALAEAREALHRRQGSQELDTLLRLGTARLGQGQLVEPEHDSAKRYLNDALRRSPADPPRAVRRLREEYQHALASQWSAASARHDAPAAANWLRELQASGVGAERLAELTRAPAEARAAAAATAAATPTAPAPTATVADNHPAADNAGSVPAVTAAAAAAAPVVTPATPAKLQGALEPDYPALALRRQLAGWVEVEFRVGAGGKVEEAHVRAAEPAHVFDDAALDAIRHSRYTPARLADGTPVAATLALKVRFVLPENRR